MRQSLSASDSVVFAMTAGLDSSVIPDPIVELALADGSVAAVRLSDVAAPRPILPVRLWKHEWLGQRCASAEAIDHAAERFLQTYLVPISVLLPAAADAGDVERLSLRFEGTGSVLLDSIGFEQVR